MPRFVSLARASALALALLVSVAASAAPADDTPPLQVSVEDGLVAWTPTAAFDAIAIEISGPDGIVARRSHSAETLPSFDLLALGLPDGEYTYRAVVSGLEGEHETIVQTGTLVWAAGVATAPEASMALVHTTDVVIQGSLCVGFDCVNGESFGFDTLRLKENNLRIHFQDTSTSASFPTRDWRIRINDTSNGGANYFGIEDSDAGTIPFRVLAGAGNNALYVDAQGDVGLNTSNPVVELHISDGDSPTLRLEQSGASGFTPQTWDMAGNETNFFVRDVTNGSKLPFRIRPGAPDNSIYVDTDGDVGLGTNSFNTLPDGSDVQLDVRGNAIFGTAAAVGSVYITGELIVDGEVDIVNKSVDVDKDVKVGRDLILQRYYEQTDNYDVGQIPFFILDRNNSSNAADDVMLMQLDHEGNLAINGTLTENGVPFNASETRAEVQALRAENEDLRERLARLERLVQELAARDQ